MFFIHRTKRTNLFEQQPMQILTLLRIIIIIIVIIFGL